MTAWSLVTYLDGARPRVGALVDPLALDPARVVPVPWLPEASGVGDVVARWAELRDRLVGWDPDPADAVRAETLLVPLRAPGKLLFAGANYVDHAREMGILSLPAGLRPYFFLLPGTSLAGPGEAVGVPMSDSARVDWEAELAVVIGLTGREIAVEDALAHVAGYTIVNDITARGAHYRDVQLAPPFAYDWLEAKGRDGFCPMGPGLVPAAFVPDPQDLSIRLWVNGELLQDGHTSDMIFTVAELISAASRTMTLEPGDVISTGTPAGVGAALGRRLRPGDVVTAEISRLGRLQNPVVAEESAPLAAAPAGRPPDGSTPEPGPSRVRS